MKKAELEQELDETKKEVKALRREINKIHGRWKFFDKFAVIAFYIILGIVVWFFSAYVIGYGMLFALGKSKASEPLFILITYILTYSLTIFLTIAIPRYISKKYKTTKEEIGLSNLPTFTDIGIAFLGYIGTIVLVMIITSLLSNTGLIDPYERQDIGFSNLVTGADRAFAYIAIAVVAPIAEEIIFRGWLYGKLRKELKIIPAVIIVSVLFGLAHGQLTAGISVGILSVILCLEREITGTIHAGIITHMIQNSVAFALLIAQGLL